MTQLVPCGGCARHVRAQEGPCPFCGAVVSPPPRAVVRRGTTRAAIFYLGATLAACGGQSQPEPEPTIVQPYGAPPDPDLPEPIEPEAIAAPDDPPEPPPDPPPSGTSRDMGGIAQPNGAPPPPPPLDPVPIEPGAIVPPYGAPARPDGAL